VARVTSADPVRSFRIGSREMTFRVGTRDGTVVIVDAADLELVTAYLALRGYPPTSVEATDVPRPKPRDTPYELKARAGG
jgi:hypothetical protein